MAQIVVTGAGGQLGRELEKLSSGFTRFQFIFCSKNDLDIADEAAVGRFFAQNEIQYCINCAAYTAVDKAEEQAEMANRINARGAEYLARACKETGATLFHISTDFVFDGGKNTPYHEKDKPHPLGVYGTSKWQGEQAALENNPKTIVVRTSWLYASFGHNFVRTMLRLGRERDVLKVVDDQIGTPTYAQDLARDILAIITKLEEGNVLDPYGTYHYSNEGVASWYDFAAAIFDIAHIKVKLQPIPSVDFPTPAKRPAYSVLDKRKIKETFVLEIRHWRESLKDCLSLIS